jgi:uncharacterized protein YneF (UPF0154 family)
MVYASRALCATPGVAELLVTVAFIIGGLIGSWLTRLEISSG